MRPFSNDGQRAETYAVRVLAILSVLLLGAAAGGVVVLRPTRSGAHRVAVATTISSAWTRSRAELVGSPEPPPAGPASSSTSAGRHGRPSIPAARHLEGPADRTTLLPRGSTAVNASTTSTTTTTIWHDPPGVVTRHGSQLALNNATFRLVGGAAPQFTSDQDRNLGCGERMSDEQVSAALASQPSGTTFSIWATQRLGFNRFSGQIDFGPIDRVVHDAESNRQFVVLSLTHQEGYCSDDHWKNEAWYAGGYTQPDADAGGGTEPLAYAEWVRMIAARYATSKAVVAYIPVVEPQASTCSSGSSCWTTASCSPTAAATLLRFYDEVGRIIKRIAPQQMIGSGAGGVGGCGIKNLDEYRALHSSPYLDLCDLHPYDHSEQGIGATDRSLIDACTAVGKAAYISEWGLKTALANPACAEPGTRATLWRSQFDGYVAAGVDGWALWSFATAVSNDCSYGVAIGDPVLSGLQQYQR